MDGNTEGDEGPPLGTPHRILQDPGEGSECPFCHKHAASEMHVDTTCARCGMGIPHPCLAPKAMTPGRRTLYFCCSWCLRIYRRDHEVTPQVDGSHRAGCG